MKLRHTTINDLPEVIEIINQAKLYFKNEGIDQWQDGYPKDNGKILATTMISINIEPTYNYIEGNWLQNDKYMVIHRIAIHNDQKGKGLAKIIIDEALKLHPDIHSIRIDTHDDNLSMQRFLIKYGFTYCGTIYLENKSTRRAYEKVF